VLLSWGLWKRRFGGDPAVLNQTIDLDAKPYTVIGVMPAWFDFPDPSTQLWTPICHDKPEDAMTAFSNHMFRLPGDPTADGYWRFEIRMGRRGAHCGCAGR
jgi:hypothetical protein